MYIFGLLRKASGLLLSFNQARKKLTSSIEHLLKSKVQIMWEGHKIWKKSPTFFESTYLRQNKVGDFSNICGLLRISEF